MKSISKYMKKCVYINTYIQFQFNTTVCCSVAQLCPILCDPMDCSMPGFPVLHCLPEFSQTHVH